MLREPELINNGLKAVIPAPGTVQAGNIIFFRFEVTNVSGIRSTAKFKCHLNLFNKEALHRGVCSVVFHSPISAKRSQ